MKALTTFTNAALLTLFSSFSHASSVCSGTIDMLVVTQGGSVEVYSAEIYGNINLGRSICNINTTWKNVTPDTCKVWYSTLLALVAQNKPVKVHYLQQEMTSCESLATFNNAVAPYAVNYSKN